jgi:hypothetical protein
VMRRWISAEVMRLEVENDAIYLSTSFRMSNIASQIELLSR